MESYVSWRAVIYFDLGIGAIGFLQGTPEGMVIAVAGIIASFAIKHGSERPSPPTSQQRS